MSKLKLVFAGTPAFAAGHLQALIDAGHNIVAVYTQPDRAAGRGKKLQPSPVKQVAQQHQLPVFQPASLKDADAQRELSALNADLMVVVAYGLLLPQAVLDLPRLGCINVHASLLPRWRGAAPIERAILAGDKQSGVTIMQMDAGLDTGAMIHKIETPISDADDRQTLENRLAVLGCQALIHTLANFDSLASSAEPQTDDGTTYARKLDKSEALIDWNQTAEEINRCIRAGIGRNPAYTFINGERIRFIRAQVLSGKQNQSPGTILGTVDLTCEDSPTGTTQGQSLKSLRIACRDGELALQQVQLPGKNVMSVTDLLNARRAMFEPGKQFSSIETPS
ncbi:methionyl-tRNA formyltransferase [Pseudohongiella sp. O18]|uniref:methionyl-tRNA formyltransferase n=1 Tax=Pseudohongiella sp. O18 TaxID=2904248 RepID=UPI001F0114C6|nr:methionyl-tRNA formyltransferase [Pseudohongiella sp. O18]